MTPDAEQEGSYVALASVEQKDPHTDARTGFRLQKTELTLDNPAQLTPTDVMDKLWSNDADMLNGITTTTGEGDGGRLAFDMADGVREVTDVNPLRARAAAARAAISTVLGRS